MQRADEKSVQQARMVLDFNWTGEYTMPGPRLYPHQRSWDSAFIAIGYSHYDQERATRELRHLFEAQWKSGLLPQIVFKPLFSEYFPGIEFWHAERSPDAPRDRKTSGVVQPPVHATAHNRLRARLGPLLLDGGPVLGRSARSLSFGERFQAVEWRSCP
jgi:hypothetical protein